MAAPERGDALNREWRAADYRRALLLERLTVAWNSIEGLLAVAAGILANSIALTGFGIDSAIETATALLVLARLHADAAGRAADEQRERRLLRFIAATFFALALYIVVDSTYTLITSSRPQTSPIGMAVTAGALVVMPLLARGKRRAGEALGSAVLLADAAETKLCALLALSTLVGLVLYAALGWWWVDPIAALVVAALAVREGREAWEGELCCD